MSSLMKKTRIAGTVAAIAALSLSLTACGGGSGSRATATPTGTASESTPSESGPAVGGTITAGMAYDMKAGFDPASTTGALPIAVNWHVLEGLYELDPATRAPYLALAGADPTKVDDTTYEVTLRQDAKFSTGNPVTADDVVFSYQRVLDEANEKAGIYRGFLAFLDKVEKKNDTTVTVKLKYPFSLLKERLSVVKVVPKDSKAEDLEKLPVGSGQYVVTKAEPGKVVEFKRNEHYNGTVKGYADNMVWNVMGDATPRVTAMQSGTVDAIESVPADTISLLEGKAKVELVQGFNLPFVMFNTQKAPFNNKAVRQAVLYAINVDKLIADTQGGAAEAATSFLPKNHPNYHAASTVYKYDMAKAKEMLAAAGVSNLKITLHATDQVWIKDMLPLIQQNLKEIGIEATLDSQASGGLYPNVIDTTNYDLMIGPGDPSVFGNDPDILMRGWYGKNVWSEKRYRAAASPEFAELQGLLDKAVKEEGAAQQETWNKAFDMIADQAWLYPLFHRQMPTAWNADKLDNFRPIPVTGLSFLDVSVKK